MFNIDLLVAILLFLTALFYFIAYGVDTLRILSTESQFLYYWLLYVLASFFFVLYAIFVLYRTVVYGKDIRYYPS